VDGTMIAQPRESKAAPPDSRHQRKLSAADSWGNKVTQPYVVTIVRALRRLCVDNNEGVTVGEATTPREGRSKGAETSSVTSYVFAE